MLVLAITVCQEKSTACAEDEEGRGVSGGKRVAMVHIDALNQRQNRLLVILKGAYRAIETEGVF